MHFCNCQYGFEWGAAKITRLFSDEKAGWVTIEIATPKQNIQVYVTKTGKIRVHGASEWLPQKDNMEVKNTTANSESKPCCKATFALVLEYTLGKVTKCPVCGVQL